jgi:hypothetical protein
MFSIMGERLHRRRLPSIFIFSFKFWIYKVSEICSGSSGAVTSVGAEDTMSCMASGAGGAATSAMALAKLYRNEETRL